MSPGRRQIITAPLAADPDELLRNACRAQGCTCGSALSIERRPLPRPKRPAGTESYGRASEAVVRHLPGCPLLRQRR